MNEANEFFPFDDEYQFKFYRELPNLERFIIPQSDTISTGTNSSNDEVDEIINKLAKS